MKRTGVLSRRRVVVGWSALVLWFGLVGWDLSRAAPQQVSARALVGVIRIYQATASPLLARLGARCRFEPTCSEYGRQTIARHGALEGVSLTLWRIARCGPWTPSGTVDPVP